MVLGLVTSGFLASGSAAETEVGVLGVLGVIAPEEVIEVVVLVFELREEEEVLDEELSG